MTAYTDVNPATLAIHLISQEGAPVDSIDHDSFIAVSNQMADNGIKLTFEVEDDAPLPDILEAIKTHTSLVVYHDGDKIRCRWDYGK